MKKTFILLNILIIFTVSCAEQDSKQISKKSKIENVWEVNYLEAVAKAKKENKSLLLNFTGSDWCGWCIKLEDEVFSREDFVNFATENLILVKVDFPRQKKLPPEEVKQNAKLAKKHSVTGFPTILILDANENLILSTSYKPGGAKKYVKHLQKAMKNKTPKKEIKATEDK